VIRIFISLTCLFIFHSCAQPRRDPAAGKKAIRKQHQFILGESTIHISETVYQPAGKHLFIRLHDNESTGSEAATEIMQKEGGRLVSIENNGERNIGFRLKNKIIRFDPNRIFTHEGRVLTTGSFGSQDTGALIHLKKFSEFILGLIPDSVIIIALHNNGDKELSILNFRNGFNGDASTVHMNPSMDEDDFIYTTSARFFTKLKAADLNVVLQNNLSVADDGSLSVLCGQTGRTYINIEAEHGHLHEQQAMIRAVLRILHALRGS
jgi:hypothetical protein